MRSWRDQILKEFTPKVSRLTLAADPDGLLLEEGMLEGIRGRGFELMPFEDHIAFRYAYESKFRSRWDQGEDTDLVVVLRSQASDPGGLPHDLLRAGRKLSFHLGDIFPSLSYSVVAALDRGDLDALYGALVPHPPAPLGDNATRDFILRHVFDIAPELVRHPTDLLHTLLRRHYRRQNFGPDLDGRFIQLLRQNAAFNDWPLEILVSDREAFFAFLQERWPRFLDHEAAKGLSRVFAPRALSPLAVAGPAELSFDHEDIRVYIDNLFVEGILHAVPHDHGDVLSRTWVGIGVRTDPTEDRLRRLDKLLDRLEGSIPAEEAKHPDWFHFARGWAETILLANPPDGPVPAPGGERFRSLQARVDGAFAAWLVKRYAGLVNLPPEPPVMLHHLPRFLARQMGEDRKAKIALIVVDGLALDQWLVVREALASRHPGLRFREEAVFAWIPSVTSVSRQATFAGKIPLFFSKSIQTTDREPALWAQFWRDQGLTPQEVVYRKVLKDEDLEKVADDLSHPKAKVVGLAVDKVDKIMHGMALGTSGMHNQVGQWARQPYVGALLDLLLERGFLVYLTSDHGNIEAEGCGRPSEGAVADLRGERVRIYPDGALREGVHKRFPDAMAWDPVGLPEKYFPLLAPPRRAFVREGERIVSHGGISVEELIVPFIRIDMPGGSAQAERRVP